MKFDMGKIENKLFEHQLNCCNKPVREKIIDDYGLEGKDTNTFSLLAVAVVEALNQKAINHPERVNYTNKEVFEAAVKAIGSNFRKWVIFLNLEDKTRIILCDYEPQDIKCTETLKHNLEKNLKGRTCRNDANAICKWVERLSNPTNNFYDSIKKLHSAVKNEAKSKGVELEQHEITLCMISLFAQGATQKWGGLKVLQKDKYFDTGNKIKLPGMGFALASEFLRNLGWNAFKIDSHLERLFKYWEKKCSMPIPNEKDPRITKILNVLNRDNQKAKNFIRYSLAGIDCTPQNYSYSKADNLIWLLGSYVEKGKKESNECYLVEEC